MNPTPAPATTTEATVENASADTRTSNSELKPISAIALHRARLAAFAALALTLIAWATIFLDQWVSLSFSIFAIAASIFGMRQPRSASRTLAITCLIAAAVLLLDILILLGVICYLKTL